MGSPKRSRPSPVTIQSSALPQGSFINLPHPETQDRIPAVTTAAQNPSPKRGSNRVQGSALPQPQHANADFGGSNLWPTKSSAQIQYPTETPVRIQAGTKTAQNPSPKRGSSWVKAQPCRSSFCIFCRSRRDRDRCGPPFQPPFWAPWAEPRQRRAWRRWARPPACAPQAWPEQ